MKTRPRCDFMNVGFDVNRMIKITRETLLEAGMNKEAQQFMDEVSQARTLGKVFATINKFVDTTSELFDYLAERRREKIMHRVK